MKSANEVSKEKILLLEQENHNLKNTLNSLTLLEKDKELSKDKILVLEHENNNLKIP